MGYIYKITNSINDKVYVGQTIRPIEKRFVQHINDSRKYKEKSNIKLYNAMNKYGTDKFEIELLEECDKEVLNEREIYWIDFLDSFKNGYNSTGGGKGRLRDDDESVMDLWDKGSIVSEIVKATGHSQEYVIQVLDRHGVHQNERNQRAYKSQSSKVKVPVYQYDLDGNYVGEYASIWDAEKETGINHGCINGVLCNAHYSAGYYQWRRYKADNIGKCPHKFCGTAKKVHKYTFDGDYVCSYDSITKASVAVGLKSILPIRRACKDKNRVSAGHRWSYEKVDKLPPPNRVIHNQYTKEIAI